MQPQSYNTGRGGPDTGEPRDSIAGGPQPELPPPAPGGQVPAAPPMAAPQPLPVLEQQERWAKEVERVFSSTVGNPHARSEQFAKLRRQYQEEVLGLKRGREQ